MTAWPTPPPGFLTACGSALCTACWQGVLAFGLVWLVFRIWPQISPRVQCWAWRLAYLKVLLALTGLPSVDLPWLPAHSAALGTDIGLITGTSSPWPLLETLSGPTGRAEQIVGGFLLLWLVAVFLLGVRLVRGYRTARHWLRSSQPPVDNRLEQCLAELCPLFGLSFRPRLLVSRELTSPILLGVRSPTIILPLPLVQTCALSELRLMLAHELAHLARRDLLWNWLPLLANGLFFFHPLVWLANREWRLAEEMACDELAVRLTETPLSAYGAVILKVTAAFPFECPVLQTAMGAAGSFHTLKRRLLAMRYLPSLSRKRLSVAVVIVAILALATLVPWRLTHAKTRRLTAQQIAQPQVESLGEEKPVRVTVNGKTVNGPSPVIMQKIRVNGEEGYLPRMTHAAKPGERVTVYLPGGGSVQFYTPKGAKPIQHP